MKNKNRLLLPTLLVFVSLMMAGCQSGRKGHSSGSSSEQTTSETSRGNSSSSSKEESTSQSGTSITSQSSSTSQSGTSNTSHSSQSSGTSSNTSTTSSTSNASQITPTSQTSTSSITTTSQGTSTSNSSTSTSGSSVVDVEPSSLSLPYSFISLEVGDQLTLKVTADPINASSEGLHWQSSNTDVVTVSDGTVKAIASGEAVITVTAPNGVSTSCSISVSEATDDDAYVPDTSNENIYFITNDTLSNGTYDEENQEYTFKLESVTYEQIYVKVPDQVIILELKNVTVQNNYNSPIYVSSVDKIEISSKSGSTNVINDQRSKLTIEDDAQGKGAIYVHDGDLKLKGTGTLNVTTSYYNGIHGKDDVAIQKTTLSVTAPHHAIRGNDSLTITSGNITVNCGGDGLSTKNSDLSKNGKQRGNITLNGGTLNINAYGDAIAAAHDVIIEELDSEGAPLVLTINTGSYSGYSGATITVSENKFYLKMSESIYASNTYTYAAYINEEWYPASYAGFIEEKSEGGGGGGGGWWAPGRPGPGGGGGPQTTITVYYKYVIDKPASATSFVLYRFSGTGVTDFSLTSYNAKSDTKTFNSSYDMIQVSSVSGQTISLGSWSNEDDNSTSQKGIKCENQIDIKSGSITIKSKDDGIHANYDGALENGSLPLGNVNISGGTTIVQSDDDGIHADNALNISGGTTNVTKSYEGLEGMTINVSGGETKVVASDDGVNARTGQSSSSITVSGGILDVTVPTGGDSDGIDSNGTYTQTGGIVVTRGPNSTNMAALDTDGTCQISGGTIIVLGALGEKGLTRGSGVTSYSLSLHSSGSHTVLIGGESFTFNNSGSYSRTYCYSSVTVTA